MLYYDYRCQECAVTITEKRPREERNLPAVCPCCGAEMRREFTLAGVIYRGGGWGRERASGERN